MKNLLAGGATGIVMIAYWIVAILQFFGTYAFFSYVLDWNGFIAFIAALVTCGIPVLGTILGVLGAHHGWGWGWLASIVLYLWPFLLAGLITMIASLFNKRSV